MNKSRIKRNSFTKNLVYAWFFKEGGGTVAKDNIRKRVGDLSGLDISNCWVKGGGINFSGGTSIISIPVSSISFPVFPVYTIFSRIKANGANYVFPLTTDATQNTDWAHVGIWIETDGAVHFYSGSGGATKISTSAGVISPNVEYSVCCVRYGSGVTDSKIFVNGNLKQEGSLEAPVSANRNALIGGWGSWISSTNGIIYNLLYWNRGLSISEIERLSACKGNIFVKSLYTKVGKMIPLPPTISNFTLSKGANNGEVIVTFDYTISSGVVSECEIALANVEEDLPVGAYTGLEVDSLLYNVFKPIYKTLQNELPAMAGDATGTYTVTIKLPNGSKIYAKVSATSSTGITSDWSEAKWIRTKGGTGEIISGSIS